MDWSGFLCQDRYETIHKYNGEDDDHRECNQKDKGKSCGVLSVE